jgi:hypothetical protein
MKTAVKVVKRNHTATDDDEDPDSDDIAGVSSVLNFVNTAGGKDGHSKQLTPYMRNILRGEREY